ncbi:NTP transferase domain-containing protein [Deinococcus sp. RM]|uniref:NTP transferase domain-containing protein n=1 Tax=Deinococcus sp. RM TaxID=2316359 RepID=UPI000E6795B0|nr:NTP transferase domain-containing protein [Deinococcus sp. RM]RIY12746.1 nucleotide-diphospho-sugar transferase [Deinococcus sp. RM]
MNSSVPRWSAVVLGGGDPGDPFAAAHGVNVKPLIPVAGAPMALHVLRALRGSDRVGRVAYVGPTTPDLDALIDIRVTDHGTLLSNLEAGVEALRDLGLAPGERVLVVTADVPMLRPQEVRDVLDSAPTDAGLVYPVVRREVCEAAYPGVKRTYARLKDGTFTGGNLFLLDPALIGQFLPRLREVLAARKAPLKLAGLIGWDVLLRLLTGRLSVQRLEEKVSGLLGVKARALITPHAAVGTDVDKDADLTLADAHLRGTPPGH